MDELAVVARLRDDLPAGIDLAGPEGRLADEIAAAGGAHVARGTRARGKRRHGRRIAAAGAVAAALAAAVVVAQGRLAEDRPAQSLPARHDPDAAPGTQAGLVPLPGGSPRPAASAAQLVDYAIRAAAAAPAFDPKPYDWVYTKTLAATSSAGEGGMLFGPPDGRAVQQSWSRVDGRQTAYLSRGKLVFSSLLPKGARPTPGGWPNISYAYLDSLPSSPARLKAVIETGLKAQNYVIGSGNTGVFNAIQALMENVVLPLRLRAALYGVLASDPAVHFDPSVTNFAGQSGVAFYTYQEGYLKQEIVINPRTYAYMGEKDVAFRAHSLPEAVSNGVASGPVIHIRKGQVVGEFAVLEFGVVPRAGQVP